MKAANVTILGGPHDGRVYTAHADDDGNPLPLEAFETPTWQEVEQGAAQRKVVYAIHVNPANDGTFWLAVHPSVTLPE